MSDEEDNDREGLSLPKVAAFCSLQLARALGRATPAAVLPQPLTADAIDAAVTPLSRHSFVRKDGVTRRALLLFDFDGTVAPKDSVALPPGSLAMLKALVERGYEIAVLSNKPANQMFGPRYRELSALDVVIARNLPPKPLPAAFRAALQQVSARVGATVGVEHAVMIGDKTSTDGGAMLVKMPFIRVSRFPGAES